ncbi:Crp/Fnr family transcriptional regulator [Cytophagales bacterium LB-30]|uniref:Crp/Fnr family transcriptional regulator n=1 Tax=Shiella aurantiaca TaxID=3058365 RepID=A0ABT8F5Y8_9BACT|nr:Crp/Fnr family transcriptional regulator [Shiella aurantiaca]MDN4165870.1 Crp/Fnr family transcriptional regulator [Shiella aurantiaca]
MSLLQAFAAVQPLSESAQQLLAAAIVEKDYPKGHVLLPFGQIPAYMHYLVKGAGRIYYLRDGLDVTDYLALDQQFIGAVPALITQSPSHKAIELLEDSLLQSIRYATFEELCQQHLEIANLGRKMALFGFLEGQQRVEDLRFLSAAERYEELLRKHPTITQRIPLKHLASFLGTTQVSLSRIRSGKQ